MQKLNRKEFVKIGVAAAIGAGGAALEPQVASGRALAAPEAGDDRKRNRRRGGQPRSLGERVEKLGERLGKANARLARIQQAHGRLAGRGQTQAVGSRSDLIGKLRKIKAEANDLSKRVDALIAGL